LTVQEEVRQGQGSEKSAWLFFALANSELRLDGEYCTLRR